MVVLAPSGRGLRVDEEVLPSSEFMRDAVVPLLRGEGLSRMETPARSVPLGIRVGGVGCWLDTVMGVGIALLGAWDRLRSGGGRVGGAVVVTATVVATSAVVLHLSSAQSGVVRVGAAVRKGGVVVICCSCCCCDEREAMVL